MSISFLYDYENDETMECEECHKAVLPGSKYYEYQGHTFCSRACCGIWWAKDNGEIDEIMILNR